MSLVPVAILLLLGAASLASASRLLEQGPDRALLQNALCPDGCAAGSCVQDNTIAGLRCQMCVNDLVVDKVNGQCSCPAGYYAKNGANTCTDCPKGSWCPGGVYSPSSRTWPNATECPPNMTTIGKRSSSLRACVNTPGFSYDISPDGTVVAAVQCPVDTYGPGYRKQRACVPCPTGFRTIGLVQQTTPTNCRVPAGFYLKAPGQVAPCPAGEWKAGTATSGNCTKCAFGVTTPNEASTLESECKLVQPGYYAVSIVSGVITAAAICPQKYYCPGGAPNATFSPLAPGALLPTEPTIKLCPQDTWTIDVGSTAITQCLTPPGYYTTTGANATTQPCPSGSFRADWLPAAQATSCTSCGDGVQAEKTDQINQISPVTGALTKVAVTSSSSDCYIQPGQGLYFQTLSNTWRAVNCRDDRYGVVNRTYGLTPAACKDCPQGQVTSQARGSRSVAFLVTNPDGSGGFTSVKSCVNKPGYGYNGRVSQPCDKGSWNPGDTYDNCRACAYGLTTAGVGVGTAETDCGLAAGFGSVGGAVAPCPIGTYNSAAYTAGTTAACTPCPFYQTSSQAGGSSLEACNLCMPGFGGVGCTQSCGGANATYGVAGRERDSPCEACSTQLTGYSFEWALANDVWSSPAISKPNASRSLDCLSQYAQLNDRSWYLPLDNKTGVVTTTETSWASCVAKCVEPCQFVSFSYRTQACDVRNSLVPKYTGSPLVGYKALASGDVGTNAWTLRGGATPQGQQAKAKAVASGSYTFYRDENILSAIPPAYRPDAPGNSGFTSLQDCLSACDNDSECAGFIILMHVKVQDRPSSCALIKGEPALGTFIRSATRADTSRLALPDLSANT